MGVSWRSPEHREFLKSLVPEYHRSGEEGTRKAFWETMTKSWFERFPLEPPTAAEIEKGGTMENAVRAARLKKVKVSANKRPFLIISHSTQ